VVRVRALKVAGVGEEREGGAAGRWEVSLSLGVRGAEG
jgi:hypothetical protein